MCLPYHRLLKRKTEVYIDRLRGIAREVSQVCFVTLIDLDVGLHLIDFKTN